MGFYPVFVVDQPFAPFVALLSGCFEAHVGVFAKGEFFLFAVPVETVYPAFGSIAFDAQEEASPVFEEVIAVVRIGLFDGVA